MGAGHRPLKPLWLVLPLSALLGAALVLGLLALARSMAPQPYFGTVLLHAPAVTGDSSHGRRRLEVALQEPGFLVSVVQATNVSKVVAAELARSIRVGQADSSAALSEVRATAHDAQELAAALNAIARALVQHRRDYATKRLGARADRLSIEITGWRTKLEAVEEELERAELPMWARASASALGSMQAERFGLILRASLDPGQSAELMSLSAALSERIAQLRLGVGGEPPVVASVLEAAIDRASIPGKIAHLLEAREELRARRSEQADLQIVRLATVTPVPPPLRRGLWAAVFGAAVGALAALLNRIGRPSEAKHRDGPTLESHVHVPVVGSMAAALADYGERKNRPLAQTHPQHLAVHGVRSLDTALQVLAARKQQAGPIVMANADGRQNAGHVLANLAMLAADRGERVLLIETAGGSSVLSSMFTTGTQTTLSTTMDLDELRDKKRPKRGELGASGRIRYVVADDDGSPADPPVPGAFMHYFSRIYINTDNVERATALLNAYDGGIGVLVGNDRLPIREWQSACAQWRESEQPLDGLVQCGHRINERLYASPSV